mmetsp:Transcript_7350/g.22569  ORF Transcript_7350/g.22569 Transcript_7350/m.22569 type:complete len:436 (+) Transcript_7350:1092-2399(+)
MPPTTPNTPASRDSRPSPADEEADTPPGERGDGVAYVVPPSDLTRGELRRIVTRDGATADETALLSRDELLALAKARRLRGLEVSGAGAVEARARDFLAIFSRLDRTVALPPGAELGLHLEQVGEWAIVRATPEVGAVRVGDVLAAVNGHPVLLEEYAETFRRCVAARTSRVPYTLTFRRAPFHRGWLWKRPRGRSEGRFSGLTGWKKRFFVLRRGELAYFDGEVGDGKKAKRRGAFELDERCAATIARAGDGLELVLRKAPHDRLRLKSADPGDLRNWAALLTVAVAHATGGNALLRDYERERLEVARREEARREERRLATVARREQFRRAASDRALAESRSSKDSLAELGSSPARLGSPAPPPPDTPPSSCYSAAYSPSSVGLSSPASTLPESPRPGDRSPTSPLMTADECVDLHERLLATEISGGGGAVVDL